MTTKHKMLMRTGNFGDPFEEGILFATDYELGKYTNELWFDIDVWADMGEPLTITVTVKPGDKLNER